MTIRRPPIALLSSLALGFGAAAHASQTLPEGALTQLPEAAGCFVTATSEFASSCTVVRGSGGVPNLEVVVSRDGRFVYLSFATGIATFGRGADGSLRQLDGPHGCVSFPPREGCAALEYAPRSGYFADLALSPDGRSLHVLVEHQDGSAVWNFARDRTTGAIRQLGGRSGCIAPAEQGIVSASRSRFDRAPSRWAPEGRTLYLGGRGMLLALRRDQPTGRLRAQSGRGTCVRRVVRPACSRVSGPFHLAELVVSPDRRNLYATSTGDCTEEYEPCAPGALHVLTRDPVTGDLRPRPGRRGCIRESQAGRCSRGRALFWPIGAALTPDGRHLYATADGLAVFARDRHGNLAQLPGGRGCLARTAGCTRLRGLAYPNRLASSPDGRTVYAGAGFGDAALGVFDRNPVTGVLRQLGSGHGCLSAQQRAGCRRARIVANLTRPVVSPDGRTVYFTGSGMLAAFARSPGLSAQ